MMFQFENTIVSKHFLSLSNTICSLSTSAILVILKPGSKADLREAYYGKALQDISMQR